MAGPQYAVSIYRALTSAGYSSVQAIGIMANMWFESSLNPQARAMDSNGRMSYGLVQWNSGSYPNAASLIGATPAESISRQVSFLRSTPLSSPSSLATSGDTPAAVAGNWAYHFERCAACSPTGSYGASPASAGGYHARVSMASTVASWVSGVTGGTPSGNAANGNATGQTTGITDIIGDVTGLLKSMGAIVYGAARVLNFFFSWFQPGQFTRIGMFLVCVASGGVIVFLYAENEADDKLPVVFLLGGVCVTTGVMAFRPWPLTDGRPLRPAVYVQDLATGHVPPSQPLPDETGAIEAGLWTVIGIWTLSQVSGVLGNAAGILGKVFGGFTGWIATLFSAGATPADLTAVRGMPPLQVTIPQQQDTTQGGTQLA